MLPSYVFGTPIAGSGQRVAYTASQGNSTRLTKHNGAVRLVADTDCLIEFGTADGTTPTASATTSHLLPAGKSEYFGCSKGCVIGVIQKAAGGNLYITEV